MPPPPPPSGIIGLTMNTSDTYNHLQSVTFNKRNLKEKANSLNDQLTKATSRTKLQIMFARNSNINKSCNIHGFFSEMNGPSSSHDVHSIFTSFNITDDTTPLFSI